ncbi:MAG: D-2-hydroxyacid dehydrogenase [candidate division KSB1 bacterium]|nr:D-2-hydroxyacid dehydrogenase [candidate division KSB1 bacterium]
MKDVKIVVVDGYAMNPGDLDWAPLRRLGILECYDRTPPEQVIERCREAEIVVTNKVVFDRRVLEALPKLRCLAVSATGVNIIDLAAARERGIVVTNVPGYSTPSVVQMVFAHLLNLTMHVARHAESVRRGAWSRSPDFCFWETPLIELAGLTFGIVGLGQIGRGVAHAARAFGMQVCFAMPRPVPDAPDWARQIDLDELFACSDVVSLHCPLTETTRALVNRRRLQLMKPSAFLINTGRGPLVDEEALAEALNSGRIAGAGLDVLSVEPPPADNPLLTAKNCFITPHIAWATRASRQRLLHAVAENIAAFLAGQPQNTV